MAQTKHQENEAALRSGLYGVLSRIYLSEPDLDMIRYFKSREVQEILNELGVSLDLNDVNSDEEALIHELACEYASLFLTPPAHLPPYESFYVGGQNQPQETFEPALQGKAAEEVQRFYREHGILLPEGSRLFPDHIGIELEALRLLCELEAKADRSGHCGSVRNIRHKTGTFLMEHPGRWIPDFCEQIIKRTKTPYFRIAATLTRAFIESEVEDLAVCCEK